ncbi:MAG TPA: MBOAT family O-acyltransferase [Caulobacteraceae bacterium]|jgi:D-alanyl-lipoteichoic acid acyltransferase DltB (MBOAT superfamily)|nr:MBOAT family O-acyltransferase [Caulobacteraceae bacterium]
MLFNSIVFVFGFLPLSLLATYVAGRWRPWAAKLVLLILSLAFYAAWRVQQLPLLLFSIGFNYGLGALMLRARNAGRGRLVQAGLVFGILVDLGMLGWFKYANFLVDNLHVAFGADLTLAKIALPLAISFFTFQKIAYLIDVARGETTAISLLDFSLFAAFYPQLIAGPIVHFGEVVPQIRSRRFGRLISRNLMVGLVMFAIGLCKKTVIADTLAAYADPMFQAAHSGRPLGPAAAWLTAITFTVQLYFDFSGYSDMAIGLGRMLGVKLPLNFHSPLRSPDIIEYWRRWHMTLQRFIVAYIFEPLSLSLTRLAALREIEGWPGFFLSTGAPVLVTFTVVGLWHGAGWSFILFGVAHAVYVLTAQAWREHLARRRRKLRRAKKPISTPGTARIAAGHALTLLAVLLANVMFRARTLGDALHIWRAMVGAVAGVGAPVAAAMHLGTALLLVASGLLIFLAPNTQQILGRFDPAYNWSEWRSANPAPLPWTWKPNAAGLAFAGLVLFLGVVFIQRGQAVFIYFNF